MSCAKAVQDAALKLNDTEGTVKHLEAQHARLLALTEALEEQRMVTIGQVEAARNDLGAPKEEFQV